MSTQPKRVFDLLPYQYNQQPLEDSICNKNKDKWSKFSTKQFIQIANLVSLGLMQMGLKSGDKVAIVSENRPEWNFIDFACQQIGVVTVPMYPNIGPKDYEYILQEADVKVIFVSSRKILQNIRTAIFNTSVKVFTFNAIREEVSWRSLLETGKKGNREELKHRKAQVRPYDLLTIIYTSGTMGHPKGVMLSHQNVLSNVMAIQKISQVGPGAKALSFLPLNHIYERTVVYLYIYLSVSVYYAESMDTIGDNIKEVKPHTFNTVPRLLEKVYEKIIKKGSELSGLRKGVFNWAINLGLKYDPNAKQSALYKRQLKVAQKLVFSKWQEALGGNLIQIQSGAAALQPRLASVFWAAGIKVFEGYGLTETAPVIAANTPEKMEIGTVGPLVEGVEVRFGDDNEIEVKGPNVMMGYYNNESLTGEVLSPDGWFKTGDVGRMENGCLKITDRKKELFKTSGGLYIAPQQLENKLKESILVENAMVVGDGRKFPAALIVPNFDELIEIASKRFILFSDFSSLIMHPEIEKLFKKEMERFNEQYGKWEKIKQYRLVPDSWGMDSGELTPTLKLKRRVILKKYNSLIEDIYKEDGAHLFDDVEAVDEKELDKEILEEINK